MVFIPPLPCVARQNALYLFEFIYLIGSLCVVLIFEYLIHTSKTLACAPYMILDVNLWYLYNRCHALLGRMHFINLNLSNLNRLTMCGIDILSLHIITVAFPLSMSIWFRLSASVARAAMWAEVKPLPVIWWRHNSARLTFKIWYAWRASRTEVLVSFCIVHDYELIKL